MNNDATPMETLFEKAEAYSKTSLELFKLNAVDKYADVVSSLAMKLAISLVVALFVLIINIGIAFWIGEELGRIYYGFFIIGGFYAFLGVVLYCFRHSWLKTPFSNSLITQMLKQKTI